MSEGFQWGKEIRDNDYFRVPSFSFTDSLSPRGGGGRIKVTFSMSVFPPSLPTFQETFSVLCCKNRAKYCDIFVFELSPPNKMTPLFSIINILEKCLI